MDLPDDVKIRAIFAQGGAFKAKLAEDGGTKFRYYFVLNIKPKTDSLIVLSTSTTQFEEHKNCDGGDDVHIPLSPKDYKEFTKSCLICCNRPRSFSKASLERQLKSQKYDLLSPLPDELLQKILRGIAKSKVVSPKIKRMVLPEEKI